MRGGSDQANRSVQPGIANPVGPPTVETPTAGQVSRRGHRDERWAVVEHGDARAQTGVRPDHDGPRSIRRWNDGDWQPVDPRVIAIGPAARTAVTDGPPGGHCDAPCQHLGGRWFIPVGSSTTRDDRPGRHGSLGRIGPRDSCRRPAGRGRGSRQVSRGRVAVRPGLPRLDDDETQQDERHCNHEEECPPAWRRTDRTRIELVSRVHDKSRSRWPSFRSLGSPWCLLQVPHRRISPMRDSAWNARRCLGRTRARSLPVLSRRLRIGSRLTWFEEMPAVPTAIITA